MLDRKREWAAHRGWSAYASPGQAFVAMRCDRRVTDALRPHRWRARICMRGVRISTPLERGLPLALDPLPLDLPGPAAFARKGEGEPPNASAAGWLGPSLLPVDAKIERARLRASGVSRVAFVICGTSPGSRVARLTSARSPTISRYFVGSKNRRGAAPNTDCLATLTHADSAGRVSAIPAEITRSTRSALRSSLFGRRGRAFSFHTRQRTYALNNSSYPGLFRLA